MASHGSTGWVRSLLGLERPYDVFLSYRRNNGAELAQLIRRELESHGLHVFLDVRELGAGRFDEQLRRRIARARDFVVILRPGTLDDAKRPGDWFTAEIVHAFNSGRNVVPVTADGFKYPPADALPPELEKLPLQQEARYSHEFSDESIDRLLRMLRSRSRESREAAREGYGRPLKWAVMGVLAFVFGLLALGALLQGPPTTMPPVLWCCNAALQKVCPMGQPGPIGVSCNCPGMPFGITCL